MGRWAQAGCLPKNLSWVGFSVEEGAPTQHPVQRRSYGVRTGEQNRSGGRYKYKKRNVTYAASPVSSNKRDVVGDSCLIGHHCVFSGHQVQGKMERRASANCTRYGFVRCV